jgi:hypothetical protein
MDRILLAGIQAESERFSAELLVHVHFGNPEIGIRPDS